MKTFIDSIRVVGSVLSPLGLLLFYVWLWITAPWLMLGWHVCIATTILAFTYEATYYEDYDDSEEEV